MTRYTAKDKKVLDYVKEHPGQNMNEVARGLGLRNASYVRDCLNKLIDYKDIDVIKQEGEKSVHFRYWPKGQAPESEEELARLREPEEVAEYVMRHQKLVTLVAENPGISTPDIAKMCGYKGRTASIDEVMRRLTEYQVLQKAKARDGITQRDHYWLAGKMPSKEEFRKQVEEQDRKRYAEAYKSVVDFVTEHKGASVTEVSRHFGKSLSSTSKIMSTLADYGYLEKEEVRNKKSKVSQYWPKGERPEGLKGYDRELDDLRLIILGNKGINKSELIQASGQTNKRVLELTRELVKQGLITKTRFHDETVYEAIEKEDRREQAEIGAMTRFRTLSPDAQKVWEYGIGFQKGKKGKKTDRYPSVEQLKKELGIEDPAPLIVELTKNGYVSKIPVTLRVTEEVGEGDKKETKRVKKPGEVYMFLPLHVAEHSESDLELEHFKAIHERNTRAEPTDKIVLNNNDHGLRPTLVYGSLHAGHKDNPWFFLKALGDYLESLDEKDKPVRAINMGDSVEGEHYLNESQRTLMSDTPELRDQLRLYRKLVGEWIPLPTIQLMSREERDAFKEYAFKKLGHTSVFASHGLDTSSLSSGMRHKLFTKEVLDVMQNLRDVVFPYMFKTGRLTKTSDEIARAESEGDMIVRIYKDLMASWDDIKTGKLKEDDFKEKYASELEVVNYDALRHIVDTRREVQHEILPGRDVIVGRLDLTEGGLNVRGGYHANAKTTRTSDRNVIELDAQLAALDDEKYKAPNVVLNKGSDRLKVNIDTGIVTVTAPGLRNTANVYHKDILERVQQDHSHRTTYLERQIKRPSVLIMAGGGKEPYSFQVVNDRFLRKIARSNESGEKEDNHTVMLISDVHPGSPTHQAEAFVKFLYKGLMDEGADVMHLVGDLVHGRNYKEFANEGERSSDGGPGKIRIDTQTQLLLGEIEPFLRNAPKLERMKLIAGNHEKHSNYWATGVEYALRELEQMGNHVGETHRISDQALNDQIRVMENSVKEYQTMLKDGLVVPGKVDDVKRKIDDLEARIKLTKKEGRPYLRAELYNDIYLNQGGAQKDYVPNADIFKDIVSGYVIAGQHRWSDGGMQHRSGGVGGGVPQMESWIVGNGPYAKDFDILEGGHYHHFQLQEFLDKLLISGASFASVSNFEMHKDMVSTVGGTLIRLSNKRCPVVEFYPRQWLESYDPGDKLWHLWGSKEDFQKLVKDPLWYRDKIRTF